MLSKSNSNDVACTQFSELGFGSSNPTRTQLKSDEPSSWLVSVNQTDLLSISTCCLPVQKFYTSSYDRLHIHLAKLAISLDTMTLYPTIFLVCLDLSANIIYLLKHVIYQFSSLSSQLHSSIWLSKQSIRPPKLSTQLSGLCTPPRCWTIRKVSSYYVSNVYIVRATINPFYG